MFRRRKKELGSVLVIVLWLSVIFLIAGMALFTTGIFSTFSRANTQGLFLAETALEYCRGNIQRFADGTGPAPEINSQNVGTSVLLTNMAWPMPASFFSAIGQAGWKNSVYGLPVTDASSNATIGYMSFFLMAGTQGSVQVYALGAVGNTPGNLSSFRVLHAIVKPMTYSEYTLFSGSPNQTLNVNKTYTDPFFLTSEFSSSLGTNVNANAPILGGAQTSNFNRIYVAGNLNIVPPSISPYPQFNGFSTATVQVAGNGNGPAVQSQSAIEIPSTANLYTGSQAPQQGLPSPNDGTNVKSSQVQKIMDDLYAKASGTPGTGGVVLNPNAALCDASTPSCGNAFSMEHDAYYKSNSSPIGNRFAISTEDPNNANYVASSSAPNWDPTTIFNPDGTENHTSTGNAPYKIQFNADGSVNISGFQSINGLGQQQYSAAGNGGGWWSDAWPMHLQFSDPNQPGYVPVPVIYVKGNVEISGMVNGSVTVVAEGKITATGSIKYHDHDYTPHIDSGVQTGVDITTNSNYKSTNPDLLGLITPRKIEMDPQNMTDLNNLVVSASMMEIGSNPYSIPNGANDPSIKWTVHLNSASPNYPGDVSKQYNSLTFFGSSVQYDRDTNWKTFYSNGRGNPINTNKTLVSPYAVFDQDLLRTQAPFGIALSAGYEVVYLAIVNNGSGKDMSAPLP